MSELDDMLAAVPWESLEGSDGPATDVPSAVRGLCSPDAEERRGSLGFLSQFLWDQGTVFAPSAEVVAPIAFLLGRPGFPEPAPVLEFLDLLAIGSGLFTAHRSLAIFRDMHPPEEIAARAAEEAAMLARLKSELRRGAGAFRAYLKDPDPGVRAAAERLLSRPVFAG